MRKMTLERFWPTSDAQGASSKFAFMLSHGKTLDIYKCQDLNKYNGRMAGEQWVDFESMRKWS